MGDKSMGYTELGSMKFHQEPQKKASVNRDMIKKWGLAAAVAAAVVLIGFGIGKLTGGGKYEAAIKDYVEYINDSVKGKGKKSKLTRHYPAFITEVIEEQCDDMERNLFLDENQYTEDFNLTCKYKVVDKERLRGEDLRGYQDDISDFAGEEETVKVRSGYLYEVEITVEGSMEDEEYVDHFESEVVVLKCNGKIGLWKTDGKYIWM